MLRYRTVGPTVALAASLFLGGLTALDGGSLFAQSGTQVGEWPTYGADLASTRYSPLDQIAADNFSTLDVAWRFKTRNLGPYPDFNLQAYRAPDFVGQ